MSSVRLATRFSSSRANTTWTCTSVPTCKCWAWENRPTTLTITGAVRSKARRMPNSNATCNFWRSAENLSVAPAKGPNVWAVSQATDLRRVHMKGGINLWDGGWSSGGFLADCKIDGQINSGSQQQWLSRNAEWGNWAGGNWNMVFVGTVNPPSGEWPRSPYTVIDKTPVDPGEAVSHHRRPGAL